MDTVGLLADSLLTFFPTGNYMTRPSYLELQMSSTLLTDFRKAVSFSIGSFGNSLWGILCVAEAWSVSREGRTLCESYFGLERRYQGRSLDKCRKLLTFIDSFLLADNANYKVFSRLFSLLYLANLSEYSSPVNWMCGIRISRGAPSKTKLVRIFIYTVQFAQWYFANESILTPKKNAEIAPPRTSLAGLPADSTLCPICRRTRVNPTALLANGHVYCYACIVQTNAFSKIRRLA